MSFRRLGAVLLLDLRTAVRRPLLWLLVLTLVFLAWGFGAGKARIESGDATVGGTKAFITSQFALSSMLSIEVLLIYSFFIAVLAGMAVIRDDELRTGEVIHATPLTPTEYVWGKFLAVLLASFLVLAVHLLVTIFFFHVLPAPGREEFHGPFAAANYLVPALAFAAPLLVFLAGTAFFVGARSRRPILVFVLPVAILMVCGFFLWEWTPSWLDPRIDRVLMLVDPAGFRWLQQTWLKVDRGVNFYNHAPVGFDAGFVASRIAMVLLGLGCVAWTAAGLASRLRGAKDARRARRVLLPRAWRPDVRAPLPAANPVPGDAAPLAALGMRSSSPGAWGGFVTIVRAELRELRVHPGLYLFIPIILLQTLGSTLLAVGAFDTPLLMTPGTLAVRMMNTLTLLVCLLLLFFTTESLNREGTTALASITYASPVRTASLLLGKTVAAGLVGVVVLFASFLGGVVALLVQGRVPPAVGPFLLVWGLLLLPTFLLYSSFTAAVFAVTRSRYTTYGIGLAAMILTGWLQLKGKMNWAGNWDLWDAVRWSDFGTFEVDRTAIVVNRLLALALSVFFLRLATQFFPRRSPDAVRTLHRLSPGPLARFALRLAPYAVVPVVAAFWLWVQVSHGFEGKVFEKRAKDYWKQNLATWKDAPLPSLADVDLDVVLDPSRRGFTMAGSYDLVNLLDAPLRSFPLTGGAHWKDVHWTMNGAEAKPADRTALYVFTPPVPLRPGDHVRIGFRYEGVFPPGISRNGGSIGEFILPSGVVLTSFSPSFVPVIGYIEEMGVKEDENRYESKVYADDFYEGVTLPAFASGTFTTKIRVTAPQDFTINSVGALTSESVANGRRTVVWKSDAPVKFFNVVAGRWHVRRGDRTALYYDPKHAINLEEMGEALDASMRWYSEWFHPFPWHELKLSEFSDLQTYAQGFPTNITFSEGIGFLTRSSPETRLAFFVTAHEAAHQWWGSILTPGKGPGGNILSEGMSHYSTILLIERMKGERDRIEFCKRIEERYGDRRQADSERPLVKIDGSRPGDTTVTYDKGGWVMWMLTDLMGREAALAGLREFIDTYGNGPDYPVLQDLVAALRPHAPDPATYDAFVKQWFFEVVVPEYRLTDAKKTTRAATPGAATGTSTTGAASPDLGAQASSAGTGAASWATTFTITNAGTGSMPVEIAAVHGERFTDEGKTSAGYRDARTSVTLGAGESRTVTLRSDFEPDRVLVDPDAKVLQLQRKLAVVRF
jgi:ABC-2 type transport system permease protein